MTYWIASDQHFNHSGIINLEKRSFSNVVEMNEKIVYKYQNLVKDDDTVFFLGDFGFGQKGPLLNILSQLPGYKIFINGSHDNHRPFKSIVYCMVLEYGGELILLQHEPPQVTGGATMVIHGHLHTRGTHPFMDRCWTKNDIPYINVCPELWSYEPVKLETCIKIVQRWRKIQ